MEKLARSGGRGSEERESSLAEGIARQTLHGRSGMVCLKSWRKSWSCEHLQHGVLKSRFHYFPGMERPMEQETIAIEKIISYTHRSHEEGTHGEAQGLEAEGAREKHMEEPLSWFLWEGTGKEGMQRRTG